MRDVATSVSLAVEDRSISRILFPISDLKFQTWDLKSEIGRRSFI